MPIKIIFNRPIKFKGKKVEANKVIEISEKEKDEMLNCGAFIVQKGLIGIDKKGSKIIINEEIILDEKLDKKEKK